MRGRLLRRGPYVLTGQLSGLDNTRIGSYPSRQVGSRVGGRTPNGKGELIAEALHGRRSMTRLALIGCGGMGGALVRALQLQQSRLKVTAAVDLDGARAQAAAERFQGARGFTDFRDVLAEADAVFIALPHHLHHPVGLECLRAGKHVFMEKPLANSEKQCLELIEAAQSSGRTLMVGYCMRFHPMVRRLKELIDSRAYGDVFQVSIWTEQHTEREPGHWMVRAETLGGGQLFSHGCHYIDLLLRLLGRPVRGTHLGTNYGTPWMEREGTSNVAIEFESGALGYHFGTWGAKGTRLGYSIHAHCTEGMIEAALSRGLLSAHTKEGEKVLMETERGKHVRNEIAHFAECVETGRRPETDGPGSLQGLRVIWRLYDAEEREVVADLRGCGLQDIASG